MTVAGDEDDPGFWLALGILAWAVASSALHPALCLDATPDPKLLLVDRYLCRLRVACPSAYAELMGALSKTVCG